MYNEYIIIYRWDNTRHLTQEYLRNVCSINIDVLCQMYYLLVNNAFVNSGIEMLGHLVLPILTFAKT